MTGMARWWIGIVCALAILGATQGAWAIEDTPLTVKVNAGAAFTDNRDSAPDGSEDSNVDFFLGARLKALLDWESALLDFYYAPRYRYRTDPSVIQNDSEWQHDLNVIGEVEPVERLKIRAQERFNFTDDPAVDDLGATLRRDSSYLMNRAYLDVGYDVTRSLNIKASGHHMLKRYDDDQVARQSDEDRVEAGLQARQQLNQTLALKAKVAMQQFNLEDYVSADGAVTLPRGFDDVLAGVGAEATLSRTVGISAMAGATWAEYDDETIDDDTVPFGNLAISAALAPTIDVMANAMYALNSAYNYPFSSQTYMSIYGRIDWEATSMLEFAASLEYRLEDYDADQVSAAIPATAFPKARSGDETSVIATLSGKVNITPTMAVTVGYLHENVDSDVFVSFDRNEGTIAFEKEF